MTGKELRALRAELGLTQAEAAKRWGLSQPYVSLVEQERRPVPKRLMAFFAPVEMYPRTAPLRTSAEFATALGNLGYPGFRYLADGASVDLPTFMLDALRADDVSPRVMRALPWVLLRHLDLDWSRLLTQAKALTLQNQLGFVTSLTRELAERAGKVVAATHLQSVERELDDAKLVREGSFGRRLTQAEKRYVQTNRPAKAKQWHVLSELTVDDVVAAA